MTAWEKLQIHLATHYGRHTVSEVLYLAKVVAIEEREACAKIADAAQEELKTEDDTGASMHAGIIAQRIRAQTN